MSTLRHVQNTARKSVVWFTFCLLALFTACSHSPSDTELINQQLHAMARAASAKDSNAILRNLTEDFVGNQSLRHGQMHALMYSYFQQNKFITITMTDTQITVQDPQAQSQFKLLLTGSEQILPERLRWLQVNLVWIKVAGEWQIKEASWRDVATGD